MNGWAAWALIVAVAVSAEPSRPEFTGVELQRIFKHSPVPPLPPDETNAVADDPKAALLGQALFFDVRLSANGRVSCATCHAPEQAFADGRELSLGLARGRRNTQSLWNLAYQRWYFWDGRADSLWSQALKPIESPIEMGAQRARALALLRVEAPLRNAYEAIFGSLPSADLSAEVNRVFANLGKAIAAYERRLVSRRAAFDVFVEGLRENDAAKQQALPASARRGLALFVGRGNCFVCHQGPLFSDGEFHDLGVPESDAVAFPDSGRQAGLLELLRDEFNALGAFSDDRNGARAANLRHVAARIEMPGQVKTPSLRNVALTAPYMHQGQFEDLDAVLRFYSTHEGRRGTPATQERVLVPLRLSEGETADLRAFLESLTDVSIDESLKHPPAAPLQKGEGSPFLSQQTLPTR